MPLALLSLLACNDDPALNVAKPEISVTPAVVDFGEVVVGNYVELGLTVKNAGYGDLSIEDVSFGDGTSADFALVGFPELLGNGEEGLLEFTYTPDVEGQDVGTVTLTSNDEVTPALTLDMEGMGTLPIIDLDPETLYFGTVPVGESLTLTTQITANGTGKLKVTGVNFAADEAVAYSYELDDEAPFSISSGYSVPVRITFTPPDVQEYRGEIWIESNDPSEPVAAIHLIGNTTDDPTENTAPVVEILEPDNGEYFLDDVSVDLLGYVYDSDEIVTNLTCAWYAGSTRIDYGEVDFTGNVTGASLLPVGDITLTLRCYDSEGQYGEDSTSVTVWPHDEPLLYTISGGESMFDFFSIDDDIAFYVNGVAIYADDNHTSDTLPPISFQARAGDVLHIVASDINSCDLFVDALVLHWGTGASQPLNDAVCESACGEHACYTGDYNGPWPGIFLDEEYTIAIP